LDPRPETEALIETVLSEPFETVLDLGTGSGCILVTLLAERENSAGVGVDLSEAACLQASANALLHGVERRLDIVQSDWFESVAGRFDVIVCNPPYLAAAEMEDVAPELARHEPRLALTDEADGLSVYRLLAEQAAGYLTAHGRVVMEIGWQQGPDVRDIFSAQGWAEVQVLPDLDGRDRVVVAKSPQG